MDSNFSGISSQVKGLSTGQTYAPQAPVSKNLTHPGAGAAPNPQLAAWYEQAYAYYNAVMAGDPNTPKPDAQAWNNFMAQMQWASQQLGYGGAQAWDPSMGGGYAPQGPMGQQQGPQTNQFGGKPGTMDNFVYTEDKTWVGFTGDGTHDIWSNDTTIEVRTASAKITVEDTIDTRFQPNESVKKITVVDPATGTQAVYFVHNFDPTKDKLKINAPDPDAQIEMLLGDTTSITTGKSGTGKPGAASAGTKPDASIEGVVQENGDILYEPEWAGGTIDFWANPGESQVHVIYSDANISVKPSDEVNVSMDTGGVMVVTVTHKDGTTDTYKVQKGYKANVNVNAEYITYGTPPVSSDEIPADLAERLTVNGSTSTSGETTGGASADAIVSSLLDATGRTEAQLITALKTAGYNYNTIEDLKKAIKDKEFPPQKPDAKLVRFLQILDGDLATACNELTDLVGAPSDKDSQKKSKTETVHARLVTLLETLYPPESGFIISAGPVASANFGGSISINGEDFNWSIKTNGDLSGAME